MPGLIGSVKRPQRFQCGGWTGCEKLHDFLAPEDVLIMDDAISYEDMRACEDWSQKREDSARRHQTLYFGEKGAVPTLLGHWYDETSVN